MSKKSNNKYGKLIGATVNEIKEDNGYYEINLTLANKENQSIAFYGEGSYSDWWESFVSYRKNGIIAYYNEEEYDDAIEVTFYDNCGKKVLGVRAIFHNDSDWDYGCYYHISCQDLGIDEYYYV